MKEAIYREEGWVAKVEVLEDISDDKYEGYLLKISEIIKHYPGFEHHNVGEIFTSNWLKDSKFQNDKIWRLEYFH